MSERDARWSAGRVALLATDSLVGITAIGGGIALAAGLEASNFGTELQETTPFDSYVGPGLILATAVGGSAAGAAAATVRRPDLAGAASIVAGGRPRGQRGRGRGGHARLAARLRPRLLRDPSS